MLSPKILKQVVKEMPKIEPRKVLYTYSGFYYDIKKNEPKRDVRTVYEIQGNH